MRIIGGKYRGKKLLAPSGQNVRPTADRAREAIFNILYSHFDVPYAEIDMADIFAGTGAFGLEALSRGMRSAAFVDIDTSAVLRNVKNFPAEQDKISIIRANAENLPVSRRRYHLIFMDAPYAKGLSEKVLAQLEVKNWLREQALCIVEIRHDEELRVPADMELVDERVYGLARILFLQKK